MRKDQLPDKNEFQVETSNIIDETMKELASLAVTADDGSHSCAQAVISSGQVVQDLDTSNFLELHVSFVTRKV
ncbi:hypothetical protein EON65_31505 [archaeon]|nr:MAG: hypothetical protein EON65_31505 [archaeon]